MLYSNKPIYENIATFPVQMKCQWKEKIVTTEPPRYIPHPEYSLECELMAEVSFLVILLLNDGQTPHSAPDSGGYREYRVS
jgi:hypothetical protein